MNSENAALLDELLKLAKHFSGRAAQPGSRVHGDLDMNGSDFTQFVQELEQRYGVELSWISPPAGSGASAQDATVEAIARSISGQRP